jgi:hypothetical protein
VHPGIALLRRAVRGSIVSFPAQIPVLVKQPSGDIEWRAVVLYFVRGWSSTKIAARFQVPKHRIRKSLNQWCVRALALGYVQVIDHAAFAACCGDGAGETQLAAVGPAPESDSPSIAATAEMAVGHRGPAKLDGTQPAADSWLAGLDEAIGRCEEGRDEFWFRLGALLRDVRTAAAAAVELQRSNGRTDGFAAPFQAARSGLQFGLHSRDEEHVSHAA